MNRLLKYFAVFVLPFLFLFINVSYADFSTTPLPDGVTFSSWSSGADFSIGSYSSAQIRDIVKNYSFNTDNSDYATAFNVLMSDLLSEGYRCFVFKDSNYCYITLIQSNVSAGIYEDSGNRVVFTRVDESLTKNNNHYFINSISTKGINFTNQYANGKCQHYDISVKDFVYSNVSIKKCIMSGGWTWDGTSYYYEAKSEEPDSPSLPSNAEIAQAVQAFYNSDYYKNNKDFSDFLVLYNYKTGYFSFVGHNFGIDLGQVIVPSDYEYEGYSYNQDWWKFFLRNISSEIASKLWNKYYWLYSSNDFGENITYDGKGAISDLIDIHFATSSTIVYSTTDYPVVKIETDDNGVLTPVEGTVPGNQYTYDETLDPTTNEYNPLENFIPTNPSQSILGDVDFDEINKVFEENKNILNIEGASWLFTANNKLIGYFTGFLSFLIVLILISRMLGG